MKVSCEVIRDLLPLYAENVCSEESRSIVEEHLADCAQCRIELEQMEAQTPFLFQEENLNEAQAVKDISKKWQRGMLASLIRGSLVTLIVVAVLALLILLFVDVSFVNK
ncbi:zf-HC2 domain-containing protein [Enterococcus sp. LJL51]|uniref:zf-HC2 domain-containing protein n=1 Tax=Enterococcus sp. LJL51 TaxID=3416656 RepID=UPI003CE931B4